LKHQNYCTVLYCTVLYTCWYCNYHTYCSTYYEVLPYCTYGTSTSTSTIPAVGRTVHYEQHSILMTILCFSVPNMLPKGSYYHERVLLLTLLYSLLAVTTSS
jgi:hypothetical protein